MNKKRLQKAFTLVELLVVIGLIAVLVGGIGLAFGGGDKSNALQGAQSTLQSLASAVRGQAALAGTDAALFVDVDGTSFDQSRYLRTFVIAKRNATDTGWVLVGDEIALPAGIYLVPNYESNLVAIENSTAFKKTSSAFDPSATEPVFYPSPDPNDPLNGTTPYPGSYAVVLRLNPRGKKPTTGAGSTQQLVLSAAEIDPTGPAGLRLKFTRPELVRGALISGYGILTPINDESGFD